MKKHLLMALMACFAFMCLTIGSSCVGSKLAFNEEYLDIVELGDPITLEEYIDPMLTSDYSAILKCEETGDEFDLKMLGQWTTTYAGEFVLTYTVNSGEYKGSVSAKITVVVPEIQWVFTRNTTYCRVGDTINFKQLERNLNISVVSYYDYEFYVKSVKFDGGSKDLSNEKEYTFEREGDHSFTFAIRSEDGQELSAEQIIIVRPEQILDDGAAEWLAENNISAYDYKYISANGQVVLDAGYYNRSYMNDNVPYLSFDGNYGADTYIMVDFTGKNLPQIAFFCDKVSSSITDGGRGIYIHNGLTTTSGSVYNELDSSRMTIFGPNKVGYGEFNNRGRFSNAVVGSVADPCPLSYLALKNDCKYRYIVGFTDASDSSVILHIILVNMTTMEREFNYTQKLTRVTATGSSVPVDFTDYFGGSIVLYGRYGVETKWDKVYLPITGKSSIEELDVAAEFKRGYKNQYDLGAVARVSNYIDIPDTDYEFTVIDPDGEEVFISDDGVFKYEKSGTYRLIYDPKQENVRVSSITVEIMFDPDQDMGDDYFEIMGAIIAGARSGTGLITNTKSDYIMEGKQSIRYYTSTYTTDGKGLVVGISKKFLDFVFLSRKVDGITFYVYSPIALDFKLYGGTKTVQADYTGSLAAETWTEFTITRALFMANSKVYDGVNYAIAISFYAENELPAQSSVYIDNIKLITSGAGQTITEAAEIFCEQNDIELYEYKSVNDDMQVQLYQGMYQGADYDFKDDDVPYVAYKGDFGAGSYVAVDFTGKNVPQFCFFVKEISSSLVDGLAGVYIHTGQTIRSGEYRSDTDAGRVTFLGPNKVEYNRFDADGRYTGQFGSAADPSPLSIRGLIDGVHYRYVAGVKNVQVGKVVIELLLINLDENKVVVRYEKELTDTAFTADYCSGNIVMYGRYNAAITVDKVYAAYRNVSDVYEIDVVKAALDK